MSADPRVVHFLIVRGLLVRATCTSATSPAIEIARMIVAPARAPSTPQASTARATTSTSTATARITRTILGQFAQRAGRGDHASDTAEYVVDGGVFRNSRLRACLPA